jgi:NitT/TauT family transport system substrate-binding protein
MKIKALLAASMVAAVISQTPTAVAQEALKVRLDYLPWGIHAALHLASVKGWYKDAGFDVEVSDGKGSGLTIQQVAAGEVDIGQVQLHAGATARSQGLPVKAIASFVRRGDLGALVPLDSGINTVKDLEGKKVATVAATSLGPTAKPFFAAGGADPNKVNLINVDSSSQMSIYTSGAADAVLITVPLGMAVTVDKRPSKALLFADVGMNLPSYGLIVSDSTLENKKELLKKFVPIAVRAWEYVYDGDPAHIDEGVQAIITQRPNDKLDATVLRAQIEQYKPFLDTDATKGKKRGWQDAEDWKKAYVTLEKVGLIKPGQVPTDYYTNEFVTP